MTPNRGAEHFAGDQISAAAAGKDLDDVAVASRDHPDGKHGGHSEKDGEEIMLLQVAECFRWAVARARKPVRAKPDPGQECDQRDVLKDSLIGQIEPLADEQRFDFFSHRRLIGRHFVVAKDRANRGKRQSHVRAGLRGPTVRVLKENRVGRCVHCKTIWGVGVMFASKSAGAMLRSLLAYARRQNDHRDTVPLQAPLQRVGGLIVQQGPVPCLR